MFPGPPGLPIHVVETSLFIGNLDFLHFSLQSNIAKELQVAILQLIYMKGVVVGVVNIISI